MSDVTVGPQASGRALFFSILLLGLALRLFYFVGVSGHDDVDYYNYALEVLDGSFTTEAGSDGSFPFRFRIGLIMPTALMFALFGVSEYTAAVLPLLASLGLIPLAWWGGRRISAATGVWAALLMATFPMTIIQATTILPVPFAAFFSGLAVLLWLDTEDRERAGQSTARTIAGRYFLSGLCLGLGYFYRIEVGLFVLFFLSFVLVHRRAWRGCALALLGAALPVIAENIAYVALHGEFLYRLKVVSGGFADTKHELSEAVASSKSILVYMKQMFLKPTELGLHWTALLPAAVCCLVVRKQERTPFLLWFWPVTLYLFFGSWSVSSYVPTTKDPRYLINVTVPGVILLASLAEQLRLAVVGRWRFVFPGGLIAVVSGSLILLNLAFVYRKENAAGCRVAAAYIKQQAIDAATDPIWCDHHAALALRCFLPDRDVRAVSKHDLSVGLNTVNVEAEDITAGLVVADRFLIDKYVSYSDMKPPDYLLNPPGNWTLVCEAPHPTDGFAYRVVEEINQIVQGRLDGPAQSLRRDPVIVYRTE